MLATKIGDPRLQALFGVGEAVAESVRPAVRLPRKGLPPALFLIVALVLAATLFSILNEKRLRRQEPAIRASVSDAPGTSWPEPPPLFIPPALPAAPALPLRPAGIPILASPPPLPAPPAMGPVQSRRVLLPPVNPPPASFMPPPRPFAPVPPRGSGAPLLIDGGSSARPPFLPGSRGASELPSSERVHSGALADPSLTVPQGSLIPAVLETGFDSASPGFARAIVSRDVRSFDGTNVLIPRGSRLIGESSSSVSDGQRRATITWTRLIRPDGATIELNSPAGDPAGRPGVPASVNSHFLAHVGDVIATALDSVGQIFAARATPFILLSGNAASAAPRAGTRSKNVPTLKVAAGTSISVFVAHDLEFSTPGEAR